MVTSWHKEWIFGVAMCKIYMTTTSINQFTSSIFLTVMSADRYVAVCHPISSPKFRTNVIARSVISYFFFRFELPELVPLQPNQFRSS